MLARTRSLMSATAFAALLTTACSDGASSPTAVAQPSGPSAIGGSPSFSSGSGGSAGGGTTVKVDQIKVSKCYTNATATTYGEMLIKASSSDPTAHLYAYRPDGTYQGEVQNGGGSRYGGTVMGFVPFDPGTMTIKSSAGGSITVPTTPFQI